MHAAEQSATLASADDAGQGCLLDINEDEVEKTNFRILSSREKLIASHFLVPREIRLELVFFRQMFSSLRRQPEPGQKPCGDEEIPVEAFQRVFERLFFVLRDPQGFDTKDFDDNCDGIVTWGEFFHVYQSRNMKITLSLWERMFLTFDAPDSSVLSEIIFVIMLTTIIVSSFCFILGTVAECQVHPTDGQEPYPEPIFEKIELGCLVLFVLEYTARLCTCWAVRGEVLDKSKLLDLVLDDHPINLPSPGERVLRFVVTPSNVIDLIAIVPAVISAFDESTEGGGFIVLRLVRLTRIFRAFKNPVLLEPVIVIARTVQQSTKALYVLLFQMLLGVVIFGSLMWLAERGEWDQVTHTWQRKIGHEWNNVTQEWEDVRGRSPYQSIPHSFWWAIITVTTVGYGDHYPTTSLGYVIAVATMAFSLVLLSLPTGVMGGTFSTIWKEFDEEKKLKKQTEKEEMRKITTSIQRLDPATMSRLMMIQVWNDRVDSHLEYSSVTQPPEFFMGEVAFDLDLPNEVPDGQAVVREMTLALEESPDLVKRSVSGQITVRYEWMPQDVGKTLEAWERNSGTSANRAPHGTLKVTVVSADKLVNLDWSKKDSASSAYCMVYCYPEIPEIGGLVKPQVWRSPTFRNNLNPKWNATHVFEFSWRGGWRQTSKDQSEGDSFLEVPERKSAGQISRVPSNTCSGGGNSLSLRSFASGTDQMGRDSQDCQLDTVLDALRALWTDMKQVREDVRCLQGRVEQLSPSYTKAGGLRDVGSSSKPLTPLVTIEPPDLPPNWIVEENN